mgnify:CR=1 FL=1
MQVLLSRENLGKRVHYTNALNTFRELLRLGVVPIVNENDTVRVAFAMLCLPSFVASRVDSPTCCRALRRTICLSPR